MIGGGNIFAYQYVTNPVSGTGTANYIPKFTGVSTLGDSTMRTNASGQYGINSPVVGTVGLYFKQPVAGNSNLYIQGYDGNQAGITILALGGQVGIAAIRANGTYAVPTTVVSGNAINVFVGNGYDGTQYTNANNIAGFYANETWDNAGWGTEYRIYTTPVNTTANQLSYTIDSTGFASLVPIGFANGFWFSRGSTSFLSHEDNAKSVEFYQGSSWADAYVNRLLYGDGNNYVSEFVYNSNYVTVGLRNTILKSIGTTYNINLVNSSAYTIKQNGTNIFALAAATGDATFLGHISTTTGNVSAIDGTLYAQASGTESSGYRLDAVTMGYDATNVFGWITAGGPAARANLMLQTGGGKVGIGLGITAPAFTLDVGGEVRGDTLRTLQGTLAGVGPWRLGQFINGAVAPDPNNYVEVEIDGTIRKLIIAA